MIKNVLVTGGAGRLGNYVCPYLKSLGYNVAATDIVAPNRESANMKARIPFIKADLLDCGEKKVYNLRVPRSGNIQMGVIRFRRDTWRPDCAPRMSVGLVNHPAKP